MSFKFAAAHFGQSPAEGGGFDQFGPPAQQSSASTGPRSYGEPTTGAKKTSPASVYRESKGVSASGAKKVREALAKAEYARAQEGIKRYLDDVIQSQLRWKSIVDAKAAFDAAGRLSADREVKQRAYENAVASKLRLLPLMFSSQAGWDTLNVNPPRASGAPTNRFVRFVLAPKLFETLKKGPYGSWITRFSSDTFKTAVDNLNRNVQDSKFSNGNELAQFEKFPYPSKIEFFKAAVDGTGFPDANFDAGKVAGMSPAAYESFTSGGKFSGVTDLIEAMIGSRLADVYGVPAKEVAALRAAVLTAPGVTGELYAGGRTAAGHGGAAFERGDYAAKQESYRAVRERQNANLKKSEAEAALTLARKEAARVDQEKASADARGDTSEAARLEQERNALEQKAKEAAAKAAEAEAAARAAEAKAAESAAAASTSTTVSSGGAAMTAPSAGGGSSVTDVMTAPPAESLTPVVTTDSTGAPAVVVPDASVVAPAPMMPEEKTSPVVALLAVAAIGGGIWWYMKNRKGA